MIDRDYLKELFSLGTWVPRLVFWGGALAVGATAALLVQCSRVANQCFLWLLSVSPWLPFFVMPAGLSLIAWLSKRYFDGAQGSGVPQTLAALTFRNQDLPDGLLSLRIAAGKLGMTFLSLCCGASVGHEGPMVQIGASLMHSLRRFSRGSYPDQMQGLIVAGGAAGVAAAFNAPLAGIAFAIEELSRSFEHRTNGLILIAVIFAGLATQALYGNYTYFGIVSSSIDSHHGWLAVGLCGIVGGLAGGLFARTLIWLADAPTDATRHWIRTHPVAFAALCGLFLAVLGAFTGHQGHGTGYEEVRDILAHGDTDYSAYGLTKFLATLASSASGVPGGIFAPSLAVGAGVGMGLSHLMPGVSIGAFVVLGMVAYFSGVTQAPLTTFIIVMEMTDNHGIVIPLMAAALIASGISRIVCPEPIYKALSTRLLCRRQTFAS